MAAYDWRTFLRFAELISTNNASATIRRSAASRAYYAAFNICRDWLEDNGYTIPNNKAHAAVWRAFTDATGADHATVSQWRLVGSHGAWMSRFRNEADYDDHVPDLENRLQDAIERAHKIIDDLLPRLKCA